MKRLTCCLLLFALLLSLPSCGDREKEYVELGIPSSARYETGEMAACPWDLFVYNGILYVGAGDYDKNAGPITVWGYDTNTEKWVDTGTLADEEVAKFLLIGDTLTVPGTDPQGDWSHGNYYQLKDGKWETSENVPDGIHMFDIVEYAGALFAGLGVVPGSSPIVRSLDGGKSFSPVPLKRDGADLDTSAYQEVVRVYDFFLCDGELYALFVNDAEPTFCFDLFRYAGDAFVYVSDMRAQVSYLKTSHRLINAKVTFKDKLFFTTGYLYTTENMKEIICLEPPHSKVVCDLLVDGDRLYVLSAETTEEGEGYRISVSSTKTGDPDDFKEEFYFYYSAPPLSFAKDGKTFYFGMGSMYEENASNGMILKVTP